MYRNLTHLEVYASNKALQHYSSSSPSSPQDTVSPNIISESSPPDTLLLAVNLSEPQARGGVANGADDPGIRQKTFAYSFQDEFGGKTGSGQTEENPIQVAINEN